MPRILGMGMGNKNLINICFKINKLHAIRSVHGTQVVLLYVLMYVLEQKNDVLSVYEKYLVQKLKVK